MNRDIVIERAGYEDLIEILFLQKAAFVSEAEIYNNYKIDALTQTLESMQSDFNKYVYLKAVRKGKIVGSVKGNMTDGVCYIGRLIVDPECQNKGVGKKLMRQIETEFSNARKFQLYTAHKSIKNLSLYRSVGYVEVKRFVTPNNPDLILLEKENKSI